MSALKWTITGASQTTASIGIDAESQRIREWAWHIYVSGTTGAGLTSIQVSYAPDTPEVADGSSRWFTPAALNLTGLGDSYFQAKFRKIRIVTTGGDGTTNLVVEIR